MKRRMNRWVAFIAVLALIISVFPFSAFAAQPSSAEMLFGNLFPQSIQEQLDEQAENAQETRSGILFELLEKMKETAKSEEDIAEDNVEDNAEDIVEDNVEDNNDLTEWEEYLDDTDGEENEPSADPDEEVHEDDESALEPIAEAVVTITAGVEKAAAAGNVRDNGLLDGLNQKNAILSKINGYGRNNTGLRTGTTIYMFEGGSNSGAEYSVSGTRDQAVAIVVKDNEIVHVEPCCSTIPDGPDVMAKVWPSAATVKDGTYAFSPGEFGGYNAFKIADAGDVPCIRLNPETKEVIETTADGIYIHTRNGCSTGGWSTGCMLVADGGAYIGPYASFRDAVGSGTSGSIVIDRSLAIQRLGALYDERGYIGAIKKMTNHDYTFTSTLHFDDPRFPRKIERGTDPGFSGSVGSNYLLTEVSVSITNEANYLNPTTSVQSYSVDPKSKTYDLSNKTINNAIDFSKLVLGSYRLKLSVSDASGKKISSTFPFIVEYPASTLHITLTNPGKVVRGTANTLKGTVESNLSIEKVHAYVTYCGYTELSKSVAPNANKYSLQNLAMDLSTLPKADNYILHIDAKDESGATASTMAYFNVENPPSTLKVVSKLAVSSVRWGSTPKISGSVESNYQISVVTATLTGATSRSFTANPNTKSYNLANFSMDLTHLPRGVGYRLNVSVKDASGKTLNLPTATFNVLNPAFTIKFNANGGSGTMANQTVKDAGSTIALTANKFSTKAGYHFDSWNTKKDGTGKKFKNKSDAVLVYAGSSTVTLYARWAPNTFTIDFKPNAGGKQTGAMSNQTVTYNSSTKINKNSYARLCYNFTGWNTNKNGTGTVYKDQAAAGKMTTTNNATIMLYAQWKLTGHNLPSGWTCSSDRANHYKQCKKCGEIVTQAHTFPQNYQKPNDSYHYRICTACRYQCNEAHSWIYSGSVRQCKICKRYYGQK